MPTVERAHGLPMLAVVLGGIGAVCLVFGLLGQFSPDSLSFAPVLRESTVSAALTLTGAVFITIELALILSWAQRRSTSSRSQ